MSGSPIVPMPVGGESIAKVLKIATLANRDPTPSAGSEKKGECRFCAREFTRRLGCQKVWTELIITVRVTNNRGTIDLPT